MIQPTTIVVPIRHEPDGSIRIGRTRILLELVIRAYLRGASAEGIVDSYPSLRIDEVYAVIAYYLQNKSVVDVYLEEYEKESDTIQEKLEAIQPDLADFRTRLLKRKQTC